MRFLVALLLFVPLIGQAQRKKIDLDNMSIKGELYGDDRLNLLSRQENELKNFVKFRTNYRSEIIEALPTPRPGVANK